jgi:hypothetical protein
LLILLKKLLILQSFYRKKIQILLSTFKPWLLQKELSWRKKLRALYDLQLIDSRIDEIRNVRGIVFRSGRFEDEVAGLTTRLEKITKRFSNYWR